MGDIVERQMSDIVERLHGMFWTGDGEENDLPHEAADEITRLRAEVERLTAENFSLAAWQCEFTDGKTGLVASEGGSTYCAMAKRVEALRAENERLRAALKDAGHSLDWAARKMKGNCSGNDVNAVMLAAGRTTETRAALEERHD